MIFNDLILFQQALHIPLGIELRTCIDSQKIGIDNNSSKFNYIVTKKNRYDDKQIDTTYCMPYKKIKYYKNGNIQYISYFPDEYAKKNTPQYFSPEGNIVTNCTFKDGRWIFKDSEGNDFFESDEYFGYFYRFHLSKDGGVDRVEENIKRQ